MFQDPGFPAEEGVRLAVDRVVSHDVQPPVELQLLGLHHLGPNVKRSSLVPVEQLLEIEDLSGHQLLLERLLRLGNQLEVVPPGHSGISQVMFPHEFGDLFVHLLELFRLQGVLVPDLEVLL